MPISDDIIAVKVDNVRKSFKLPHERHSSVKSLLINVFRSKRSFEKQKVIRDISFEVKQGEFFGIVGRNGSGKSTLLKLIAGIYTPDRGGVELNGSLTPFIELGVGFNPELTGRENVYLNGALLGFNHKEMDAMYDDIVEFAELERFMDQKLKNYSSGMQVRLAFSIAIRAKSDILLIDEVLAVGDSNFQRKCYGVFDSIKKSGRTVILVTHSMTVVQRYCDRAIMVKNGRIVDEGAPRKVALQYELENLEEEKEATAAQVEDETRKRSSNSPVYISGITLSGSGGKKGYALADPIEIIIDLEVKKEQTIAAGINFTRTDDLYIAGYGTKEEVGPIKLKKGTHQIRCLVEPGQLTQGDYNVNAAVFTYEEFDLIDFMDSSVGIKTPLIHIVEANRSADGLFNLRGRWEVNK